MPSLRWIAGSVAADHKHFQAKPQYLIRQAVVAALEFVRGKLPTERSDLNPTERSTCGRERVGTHVVVRKGGDVARRPPDSCLTERPQPGPPRQRARPSIAQ